MLACEDRLRPWPGVVLGALLLCGVARPTVAQFVSDTCVSAQGEQCTVKPAPLGSPCSCFTKNGPSQGQIVAPTSNGSANVAPAPQSTETVDNTCRTAHGYCATYQAPLGSPCSCFGNSGTVVTRPPPDTPVQR